MNPVKAMNVMAVRIAIRQKSFPNYAVKREPHLNPCKPKPSVLMHLIAGPAAVQAVIAAQGFTPMA